MLENYRKSLQVLKQRAEVQIKSYSEISSELPSKSAKIATAHTIFITSQFRYTRLAKQLNKLIERGHIIREILALKLSTEGRAQQTDSVPLKPNISLEKAEKFQGDPINIPSFPNITMEATGLFKYENAEYSNIIHAISEVIKKLDSMIAFPAAKKELCEREGGAQLNIELDIGEVAELILNPTIIHLPKLYGGDRIEVINMRSQAISEFRLGFHKWIIETIETQRVLRPSYDPGPIIKGLKALKSDLIFYVANAKSFPSGMDLPTHLDLLLPAYNMARAKNLTDTIAPPIGSHVVVKKYAEITFFQLTGVIAHAGNVPKIYEKKDTQLLFKFTLHTNISICKTEAMFTKYVSQVDEMLIPIVKLYKDAEEAIAEIDAAEKITSTGIEHMKKRIVTTKEKIAEDIDRVCRVVLENIEEQDKDGNTVLHKAVMKGDVFIINFLKHPKILNMKNNAGKTPLDLARESKLEILKEAIIGQLEEKLTEQEYRERTEKILQSLQEKEDSSVGNGCRTS